MFAHFFPCIIGMSSLVPGAGDDEFLIYDTLMCRDRAIKALKLGPSDHSGRNEIMEIELIRRGIGLGAVSDRSRYSTPRVLLDTL